MTKKKNIDILSLITCIYIFLPICIFITTWCSLIVSITFIIFTFIIINIFKKFNIITLKIKKHLKKSSIIPLLITLLILAIWVFLSPIGGFSVQNYDSIKHNQIIFDLHNNEWPVYYCNNGNSECLIYYLAYYLVPIIFGKLFSISIMNCVFYLWALLGIFIGSLWIWKSLKKISIIAIFILIIFSGLDIIGYLTIYKELPELYNVYIDWWFKSTSIQSFTSSFYFAPHIFIPALISTTITIYHIQKKDFNPLIFVIFASLLLWNPFVVIGLLPFIMYYIFIIKNQYNKTFIKTNIILILYCAFIFTILSAYISATSNTATNIDWIWNMKNFSGRWLDLILFCILEFLYIFVYIIFFKNKLSSYNITIVSIIILLLISLIHFGLYSDLTMRTSLPSLIVLYLYFILSIYEIRFITKKSTKIIISLITICIIILMTYSSFPSIFTSINDKIKRNYIFYNMNSHPYTQSITENDLAYQYINNVNDNTLWKYIMKN